MELHDQPRVLHRQTRERAAVRDARALPFEMLRLELDDEVRAGALEQVFRATEGAKLGAFHVDLDQSRAVEELTRNPVERRHRDLDLNSADGIGRRERAE